MQHLPSSLRLPLEYFEESKRANNYLLSMNYMLDFFEITSQYVSIVLLGMLRRELRSESVVPKELTNAIIKIDRKRPLSFGDWCNDILPLLLHSASQIMPNDPTVVALRRSISNKRNIFIGNKYEQSIVQIRNEYRGHGMTLANEIYAEVVHTLQARLDEWVSTLLSIPHYIDESELFPLVHRSEEGHVYVFQTLKDEYVSYVSSHKDATIKINDDYNKEFDEWMQALMPSFDIAKSLNWQEYTRLTHDKSERYLSSIYEQKKYNRELYVERENIEAIFSEFDQSGKQIFPLLGEPGQGKTNQLCYWVERFMTQQKPVLAFVGTEFMDTSLEQTLRNQFQLSHRKPISRLIDDLQRQAKENDQHIYIFFDALNECIKYNNDEKSASGALALFDDIYRIFGDEKYDAFRVLISCRNYTWVQHILPKLKEINTSVFFGFGREEELAIRGFSDSELENAYAIYGSLYQMRTNYHEIHRSVLLRLKDPLILKIASTNYLGKPMPIDDNIAYTSNQLFQQMTEDITSSYAGNKQRAILKYICQWMLSLFERGTACDTIYMSQVKIASEEPILVKLKELIYGKDGTSIAFGELLNKPERPILRLVDGEKLQFVYERYLEFIMAVEYYSQRVSDVKQLTADDVYATTRKAAMTEVMLSVLRNVILMDYMQTSSTELILQLVEKYGDDFTIKSLVHSCMNVLVNEHYEKQLFTVLTHLLERDAGMGEEIMRYNALCKVVNKGKADAQSIDEYKLLASQLKPIMRYRTLANQSLINGIFLTDYFNEGLYEQNPFELLDKTMQETINEVKDQTCMYIYYLSNKTSTQSYIPLECNLTDKITEYMLDYVRSLSLWKIPFVGKQRLRLFVSYLETGVRLKVLLLVETLVNAKDEQRQRVGELYQDIISVIRHLTANLSLLRIIRPFLTQILHKQLTSQSSYCNNVIEYQGLWENDYIPTKSSEDTWDKCDLMEVSKYLKNYSCYMGKQATHTVDSMPDFGLIIDKVLQAYQTGDALSYFILERMLVVQSLTQPMLFVEFFERICEGDFHKTKWWDYSQMSLLYVLYQAGIKMPSFPDRLWQIMTEWCEDWTLRLRGYYRGRNSHLANSMQLYKRNVMAWYCMVYCHRFGDKPDEMMQSLPLMRKLIDRAIAERDKELLIHLLQSINELITDSGSAGYIYAAKDLLYYVIKQIPDMKVIEEFEANVSIRYSDTSEDIIALIGRILSTAKLYFPQQINEFLQKDTIGLTFPGLNKYSNELLTYNPEGDKFSDLITHRFGNFVIWAIVNEPIIDELIIEVCEQIPNSKNAFDWIDHVTKIGFKYMFNLK